MDAVRISNERRYLTFEITDEQGEGHTYTIPLLDSMPASYARETAKVARLPEAEQASAYLDLEMEWLERFAPGISDVATVGDLREIIQLWKNATQEAGIEPGES